MTPTAGPEPFAAPSPQAGAIARQNVIKQIDREQPPRIVSLVAPAGFGKTTSAVNIISELAAPHVWIPIDSRQRTLHSFWQQTTQALTQLAGPIDERPLTDLATSADLDAVDDLVRSLAEGLASVGHRHVVGFDDLHELDDETLTGLSRLVRLAPSDTSFVVTSRHRLPWDLVEITSEGDLLAIGVDDLAFDIATTRLALELASGASPLDTTTVGLVYQQTEGWPLAVGMAADALRVTDPSESFSLAEGVAAGIIERLKNTVGPRHYRFLSDVSICPAFDLELATAVSDVVDGIDLGRLAEQSSAIVTVDATSNKYRLHHLVGELLSERVCKHEPDRWRRLHARAADWYLAVGDHVAEIEHRLSAEQYTMAAEVLVASSDDLTVAGRMPMHLEWIRRMPDEFVEENPRLVAQLAEILAVGGEIEESRRLLAQATKSIRGPQHELSVLGARFFVDWSVGNARSATIAFDALSDGVEQLADTHQPASFTTQHRLLSLVGLCHEVLDQDEHARRVHAWLDRNTAIFPHLGTNAIVHGAVARQLAGDGYMAEAAKRASAAIGSKENVNEESILYADAHVALARVSWGAGNLNDANRSLVQAARLDVGWTELFATVRRVLAAEIAASSQRFDRVEEVLNDAYSRGAEAEASDVIGMFVARRAVAIYATQAKLDEAASWSMRLSEESGRTAPPVAWASQELAAGRPTAIIERFHSSGAHLPRQPLPLIRTSLLLIQALVEADRRSDAERILPATFAVAERHQLLQPILDCPVVHELFDPERPGGPSPAFAESIALGRLLTNEASGLVDGPAPLSEELSPRELDLLPFLPSRASNRQIADELYVSLNTVKTHLKTIYRKLEVSSRDDAVARCRRLGLLAPSET